MDVGSLVSNLGSNSGSSVNVGSKYGSGYNVQNALHNIGNAQVKNKKYRAMWNLLDFGGGASQTFGFTNKDPEEIQYDPYWAYTPEQKAIHQQLGPYLQSMISGGLNLYNGNYTSPLLASEQAAIDRNARMSALGEQGLGPLLRGEFPEQYYQDSIYKPSLKQMREDIQPALEEQYAGNGGYWGGARADAVSGAYGDLADTLASKRAELGWQAQQNIPNAINAANALSSTEAAMQATPRLIKQYGLDKQYEEWVRANKDKQQYIQDALGFLDISSGVQDVGNYEPSNYGQYGGIDLGSMMNMIQSMRGNSGSQVTYQPQEVSYNIDYGNSGYTPVSYGGLTSAYNNYQNQSLYGLQSQGNADRLSALNNYSY